MTHVKLYLPPTLTRSRLAAWSMALALSLGGGCGGPTEQGVANEELNMGEDAVEASGAAATTSTRDYVVAMPINGPANLMRAHCQHGASRLMVKESPTSPWKTFTSTHRPNQNWQLQWTLRHLTGIYQLRHDVWGGPNCVAGTTVAWIQRYDNGITQARTGVRYIPVARATGEALNVPLACDRNITARVYSSSQMRAADVVGSATVIVGRAAGVTTVDNVSSTLQGSCYYSGNIPNFLFAVTGPTSSTYINISGIDF